MKRFILLLFPSLLTAQQAENMYPAHPDSLHLHTITSYSGNGPDRKLLQQNTYDDRGRMISWLHIYYNDSNVRVMSDTLIYRDDSTTVSWPLSNYTNYDSIVTVTHVINNRILRISETWTEGLVVQKEIDISDTNNYYSIRENFGNWYYAMIYRSHYTYDSLGRKISRDYTDSIVNEKQGWLDEHAGYVIAYDAMFTKQTDYTYEKNRKRTDHIIYTFDDSLPHDSTIYFDKHGRLDHVIRTYNDSTGRITSWVTTDKKGKVIETIHINRDSNTTTEKYTSLKGSSWTRTSYYNSNGLCAYEELLPDNDDTPEMITYEYSFY